MTDAELTRAILEALLAEVRETRKMLDERLIHLIVVVGGGHK